MQMFKDVLDHYGFVDLGYFGSDYTWHGRRRGELIWQRLDYGVDVHARGVKMESPPSFCNGLRTIYITSFQRRIF